MLEHAAPTILTLAVCLPVGLTPVALVHILWLTFGDCAHHGGGGAVRANRPAGQFEKDKKQIENSRTINCCLPFLFRGLALLVQIEASQLAKGFLRFSRT